MADKEARDAKEKSPTIRDLMEETKKLRESVEILVNQRAEKPPEPAPQPAPPSVPPESQFPIPLEYREIVDTALNKSFGIDIRYLSDTASFEFSILVPKKYSNAGEGHWQTYHEDRRSKVLLNAYGANGVRDYVTQVYNNFPEETKSAITYERAQL